MIYTFSGSAAKDLKLNETFFSIIRGRRVIDIYWYRRSIPNYIHKLVMERTIYGGLKQMWNIIVDNLTIAAFYKL